MKKFLLLTSASFSSALSSVATKSSKKKITTYLLFAFLAIYLCAFSGFSTYGLYWLLSPSNLQELIPVLIFAGASLVSLFMTVISGNVFLFKPKDVQTLFALPVSKTAIVSSKVFGLYLYSLVYSAIICIPSCFVYLALNSADIADYFMVVPVALFVPLLPLAVGALTSYLVGLVSSRLKHKNIFTIILSVGVFVAYIYLTQNSEGIFDYLLQNGGVISDAINKWYFPVSWATKALGSDVLYLLLFALLNLLPFVIVVPIISTRYVKITSAYSQAHKNENYVYVSENKSSKFFACFKKEFKRLFSSANYFLNTCTGSLILIVFAIMFFSNGIFDSAALADEELQAFIPMIICLTSVFSCTMTSTTSCSISIEGKALWIYKTAPIDTMTIFNAKLMLNIVINVPLMAVYVIIMSVFARLSFLQALVCLVLPLSCIIYASIIGLIINLAKPKLDWTNEVQVIKQSASVGLTLLESFCFIILIAAVTILPVVFLDISFTLASAVCSLIVSLVSVILYNTLKTWGVRKFEQLY